MVGRGGGEKLGKKGEREGEVEMERGVKGGEEGKGGERVKWGGRERGEGRRETWGAADPVTPGRRRRVPSPRKGVLRLWRRE